jgi:hypothetical protein
MKKLLVVLLFPCTAFAAKVVSDPVDPGVTHCGFFLDGGVKLTVPVNVVGTVKNCELTLSDTLSNGAHTVTATAIIVDPVFGSRESPQSLPLSFVKPAAPATPAGVRLAP